MSIKTTDVDKGYKALLRELKILEKEPYVQVGLLKDEKTEDGGSLAVVVASNEFGTDDGRIPERSFMRSTADKQRKRIQKIIDRGIDDIIKQKNTSKGVLTRVGLLVQSLIQATITNLRTPPNAESTVKQKGSTNPLIDQGQMRASMRYNVVMSGRDPKESK